MNKGGEEFNDVQRSCAALIEKAGCGELTSEEWMEPRGCLVRVVLLDQFTRTVFRGTSKAFLYDDIAASIVKDVIEKGWFETQYGVLEQHSLLTSFMHSESIENHHVAADLFEKIVVSTVFSNEEEEKFFKFMGSFFSEHKSVIERFGRYPSRNAALVSFIPSGWYV